MNKKLNQQNLNQYAALLTQNLAEHCLKILQQQTKDLGLEFANEVYAQLIAKFIGGMTYNALMLRPESPCGKKDLLEYTQKNFLDVKHQVQHSVSSGIQGAMHAYSGKTVEYYCLIKPVPALLTNTPC